MMNMDITAAAPTPTPNPACASADIPACASAAFAALLDAAAGTAGDSFVPSSEPGKPSAEKEDAFDEMAAMAMTSLLSLSAPVASPPDAVTADEIASEIESPADGALARASSQAAVADVSIASQLRTESTDGEGAPVPPMRDGPMWDSGVQKAASDVADAEAVVAAESEAGAKAAIESPARVVDTANTKGPRSEAAPVGKDDASATRVAEPTRGSKPSRAEHGSASRAKQSSASRAEQDSVPPASAKASAGKRAAGVHDTLARVASDAAAAQPAAETRGTEPAQSAIDAQAPASTAARFARALERAAIHATETNESVSGAAITAGPNSGTGQQPAFGDGSADRTTEPFTALRQSNGGVPFMVAAPIAFDARSLARAVDAPSDTVAASSTSIFDEASSTTIPERDVVAQLVRSLRVQFRDGIGEAVVKLKPEHLGSVQVSLKIENGAIKATVQAEVATVRQWIESQQDTLRSSLAEQGLRLERFVVQPDGQRQSKGDDAHEREQRRRNQRPRASATMSGKDHPVFEVTV